MNYQASSFLLHKVEPPHHQLNRLRWTFFFFNFDLLTLKHIGQGGTIIIFLLIFCNIEHFHTMYCTKSINRSLYILYPHLSFFLKILAFYIVNIQEWGTVCTTYFFHANELCMKYFCNLKKVIIL